MESKQDGFNVRVIALTLRYFFFSCVLCGAGVLGAFFFVVHNKSIDFSVLAMRAGMPSILLDDAGNEWGRFALDRREPISLSRMPEHLIQAFVSSEDHQFFSHAGLSFKGIIRSIGVNLYHGKKVQGASTITQQLVKLLFFDTRKTFKRKLQEQLYAVLIERQFSKEQILQAYLNHVYFGCGIYGVEAAAQRFWGIPASALSIDQSALLAAIIKSPRQYCPLLAPLSAQRRRNVVLRSMAALNVLDEVTYEQAVNAELDLHEQKDAARAPYLKETIRIFLEQRFGRTRLYTGGLQIQTTLNKIIQQHAEKSFAQQFAVLRTQFTNNIDGGLISIDTHTGQIKALIGGVDFAVSQFNRALQAKRQMGSIFKPMLYAAALERGIHFAMTSVDEPIEVKCGEELWRPNNYNCAFEGQITLARALATSNNIVAIKLFLDVGSQPVIDLAQRCGLRGPFSPYPALALGCVDVTLKEAVGSFNVFANHGVYVEPHYLLWVKDSLGVKIWKNTPKRERVVSARVSDQVAKILGIGLERVRKLMPQQWITSQAIGKTGTSNDSRTCWFSGATPELTTSIYVGRDDNKPLGKRVYGVRTAFPVWKKLYQQLTPTQTTFSYDPSLREVTVDARTGGRVRQQQKSLTILV